MAGDPFLKFTKAIGAEVDKSEKGLGIRSNSYTMLVENCEVKKVEEEKETFDIIRNSNSEVKNYILGKIQ